MLFIPLLKSVTFLFGTFSLSLKENSLLHFYTAVLSGKNSLSFCLSENVSISPLIWESDILKTLYEDNNFKV